MITTYSPAGPALRGALFSALHGFQYDIFNLAGQIVGPDSDKAELDFGWIAVPAESGAKQIFAMFEPDQDKGSILDKRQLEIYSVPRHRRSGDVFGLYK